MTFINEIAAEITEITAELAEYKAAGDTKSVKVLARELKSLKATLAIELCQITADEA